MANVAHDVTYSGTVTAAMEAVIWGTPAIAFSLENKENFLGTLDYSPSQIIAKQVISETVEHHLPAGILLNVNIPYIPLDQIKGIKPTRLGLRVYHDRLDKRIDPRGRPYYWIAGDAPSGIPEEGTDIGALHSGFVSVSPYTNELLPNITISSLGSLMPSGTFIFWNFNQGMLWLSSETRYYWERIDNSFSLFHEIEIISKKGAEVSILAESWDLPDLMVLTLFGWFLILHMLEERQVSRKGMLG